MYSVTPAHLRGRTRRALLAAALAVAVLPAAAHAGTAQVIDAGASDVAGYVANDGETNQVSVRVNGSKLVIADSASITARDGCTLNAAGDAECPINVGSVIVSLRDRNDRIQYAAPHQGSVSGEQGNDTFFGGIRQLGQGQAVEPVFYFGNAGSDTVDYVAADRGVRVDTAENLGSDGRPGIDLESVQADVEHIQGSNFGDTLLGSDANNLFLGRNGDDRMEGRGGDDIFDEGSAPSGADTIFGDAGAHDRVFYSTRTSGVEVSLGDGQRNDGATGEQDNVGGSVEDIGGTNFRDVLTGGSPANTIEGFGGPDTITGGRGDDTLAAGTGNNGIVAGSGNDVIFARNGEIDNIDCGDNTDTLDRDTSENRITGCERVTVGVLRLTPKAVRAQAGETARLRLRWRHPKAWTQLKTIELRLLTREGLAVGEVTIRPRAQRIGADGAVKLVRKHSRLTRKGKTVSARLALRLDRSLAGQTLEVEVEATDRRGRRQLEREAGRIRVAG